MPTHHVDSEIAQGSLYLSVSVLSVQRALHPSDEKASMRKPVPNFSINMNRGMGWNRGCPETDFFVGHIDARFPITHPLSCGRDGIVQASAALMGVDGVAWRAS
jgi:hypothetical protein